MRYTGRSDYLNPERPGCLDDLIPRSAGHGIRGQCADINADINTGRRDMVTIARMFPAYYMRLRDSIIRLRRGESVSSVQADHGLVVARDALGFCWRIRRKPDGRRKPE